jgi:hypothetical protein
MQLLLLVGIRDVRRRLFCQVYSAHSDCLLLSVFFFSFTLIFRVWTRARDMWLKVADSLPSKLRALSTSKQTNKPTNKTQKTTTKEVESGPGQPHRCTVGMF